MSVYGSTVNVRTPEHPKLMDLTTPQGKAFLLGQDHAEKYYNEQQPTRLYAGRDVARALGLPGTLSGDEYVGLRSSYQAGWSSWS